jgi:hypothetical protein
MTESAASKAARQKAEKSTEAAEQARRDAHVARLKRHVARKAKGVGVEIKRAAPGPGPRGYSLVKYLEDHDGGSAVEIRFRKQGEPD